MPASSQSRRIDALLEMGRVDEAAELAGRELRDNPDSAPLLLQLTRAEILRSNHQAAVTTARAALRIEPESAIALRLLAAVLASTGEHDEALATATAAIEREPDEAFSYRQRASIYFTGARVLKRAGPYVDVAHNLHMALRDIDQAIELFPAKAYFHVLRGQVLKQLGRVAEARAAWTHALSIDPTDADALADLAQLDIDEERLRSARQHAAAGVSSAPMSDRLQHQITTLVSRRLLTPVWVATVPGSVASLLRPSTGGRLSVAGVTVVAATLLLALAGIWWWWTRLSALERNALRSQRLRNAVSLAVIGVVGLVMLAVIALFYSAPSATTNPDEQAGALEAVLDIPIGVFILVPAYAVGVKVWTLVSTRRQRTLDRRRLGEPAS